MDIRSSKQFIDLVIKEMESRGVTGIGHDQIKSQNSGGNDVKLYFTSRYDDKIHTHNIKNVSIYYLNEEHVKEAADVIIKEQI